MHAVTKSSKLLIALLFALLIFGLAMLSSAGVVDGQRKFGSAHYYLTHQLIYGVVPGLLIFFILSRVNYKKWKPFALPILIGAICLTALVFVPGFSHGLRGARRWVALGSISFQPSEFLKLSLIIYLAAWFGRKERHGPTGLYAIVPLFLVMIIISAMLIRQPDMGTLGILIMIAAGMYFFAGAKLKHVAITFVVIALVLGIFAVIEPYRFNRIKAFVNPTTDKQGTAYHINQALISIGSGGVFGLGYGQSKQKFSRLPEPVGDSIFAVIVEELGFVGGMVLISLFVLLVLVMLNIARTADDAFGQLIVLGMALWVGGQAFINIAAISGLVPLTGVPLPFVSNGSSSMVSLLAGMGIVRNISKQ